MAAYNFLQVTEIASYDTFVVLNSLLLETDSLPVFFLGGGGGTKKHITKMTKGRWRGQVQREEKLSRLHPVLKLCLFNL